ncbi:MAG TPA: ABC transporter substrate-binding protein [bacterium]|nr:ABC transporter substrate-binding protein [bacterium]
MRWSDAGKTLMVLVSTAALALSAGGPATPPKAGAAAAKEIPVGIVVPLTGTFASLGQEHLWADQAAIDVINNAHPDISIYYAKTEGLPNLGGAKIKLIARDDQSKGDLSRTVAIQLITQDKVAWLDGTTISGTTSVIQPVAEQYGIPYSCHGCSSPTLTEKGFKTFWRTGPNDKVMIGAIFTFLKEWPKHGGPTDLKKMAVMNCDNLFCQDGRKVAVDLAAGSGIQVVEDITSKVGAASLTSEVQRLEAAKPDILFLVEYPPDTIVLQNAMKAADWMPRVVMTSDGAFDDETWLQATKKVNGSVAWMGRDPTAIDQARANPNWVKINEIYKTYSHGQNMGDLAMREFTGFMWIADVINRAGSTDPQKLLEAAAKTFTRQKDLIIDYAGIKFDRNHQNILASGIVAQIGWDGQKHLLWPWDKAAQANYMVLYPSPSWSERSKHPAP